MQVFDQFWSMKRRGPQSRDDTKKDKGQRPNKGSKATMIRGPFMHIHPPMIGELCTPDVRDLPIQNLDNIGVPFEIKASIGSP